MILQANETFPRCDACRQTTHAQSAKNLQAVYSPPRRGLVGRSAGVGERARNFVVRSLTRCTHRAAQVALARETPLHLGRRRFMMALYLEAFVN